MHAMADTWANIASQEKKEPVKGNISTPVGLVLGAKYAVIDASAVIGGYSISQYGEKLFTTAEVYNEIQDRQSKHVLATIPIGLTVQEPTAASVSAVAGFARAIGEIHSLSRADLHLIALAHSIHTSLHGEGSLHREPARARTVSKGKQSSRVMPGWGAMGGRWEAMDRMEEAEKAALEGRQGQAEASRVAAQIQELSLRGEPEQPSTPSQREAAVPIDPSKQGGPLLGGEAGSVRSSGLEDEDQWEVAAVSQNAARRRRRKEARRAYAASQASEQPSSLQDSEGNGLVYEECQSGASHPVDDREEEGVSSSDEGSDASQNGEDVSTEGQSDAEESRQGLEDDEGGGREALVSIVTADFAMQNLILQLGLKLVSPDGRQIKHISLFALRCSACFKVTKVGKIPGGQSDSTKHPKGLYLLPTCLYNSAKSLHDMSGFVEQSVVRLVSNEEEAERMFCPACGNAALQKVEVVINENGVEQFGVRMRHIIRGTKFSLPKPKGGKKSSDPILREDVMMQRMPRRKEKPAAAADPFAPEYNANTWHKAQGGYLAPQMPKGVAAALASWKHNPNERRMARTNRRK